jgi:PRTRC genetic system protein B
MIAFNPSKTENDKIEPLFTLTFHGVNSSSKQPCIDGVTLHPIINKMIQEGRYLDGNEVKAWVNNCVVEQIGDNGIGYISPQCIAQTSSHFCFYQPAFVGRMWFRIKKPVGLKVTYPALLYVASKEKRKLNVVVLDSDKRPSLDSPVYHAPLMNIDSRSSLCIGNATMPDVPNEKSISEIVKCLVSSNFTHVNQQNTLSEAWRKKQKITSVSTSDLFDYWKSRGVKKPIKSDLTLISTLNDYLAEVMND